MGIAPSEELFPRPQPVKSASGTCIDRTLLSGPSYNPPKPTGWIYRILEKGAASLARLSCDAKRKLPPY